MMKRIWKYPIDDREYTIVMPAKANILHVDEQAGIVCMWVEVGEGIAEDGSSIEERHFRVYNTGEEHDLKNWQKYIGTVKLHGGGTIVHVYEIFKRKAGI